MTDNRSLFPTILYAIVIIIIIIMKYLGGHYFRTLKTREQR